MSPSISDILKPIPVNRSGLVGLGNNVLGAQASRVTEVFSDSVLILHVNNYKIDSLNLTLTTNWLSPSISDNLKPIPVNRSGLVGLGNNILGAQASRISYYE